jgi:hypothetical protein
MLRREKGRRGNRRAILPSRFLSISGETMQKSALLAALRTELHQHDFLTFVDDPPTVAQGGKGVVVTGCPRCKKKFGTLPQFLDHLTDDVLPQLLNRLRPEEVAVTPP